MNLVEPKIVKLEAEARRLPQIELMTAHYFADGMYAREVDQPAGSLVVGKVHKREHLFILTKGRLEISMGGVTRALEAPRVLVSPPGTKRALYALEKCVYMTVHRTNKKNLDKIEKELIEGSPLALFDSSNKLRLRELP